MAFKAQGRRNWTAGHAPCRTETGADYDKDIHA